MEIKVGTSVRITEHYVIEDKANIFRGHLGKVRKVSPSIGQVAVDFVAGGGVHSVLFPTDSPLIKAVAWSLYFKPVEGEPQILCSDLASEVEAQSRFVGEWGASQLEGDTYLANDLTDTTGQLDLAEIKTSGPVSLYGHFALKPNELPPEETYQG
ncbi:MAG TPA: hypothetical protein V6D07_19120 [Trichocoleus sp.]